MLYYFLKLITTLTYAADCGPQESGGYILCTKIPGAPAMVEGPVAYLTVIYKYSLGIVGLVGFGLLVWSGVNYIFQRSNYAKLADIKDHIAQIVFGIILLVFASILLNEIDPNILTNLKSGEEFKIKEIDRNSLNSLYKKTRDEPQKYLEKQWLDMTTVIENAKGDPQKLKDIYINLLSKDPDKGLNTFLSHLTSVEKTSLFHSLNAKTNKIAFIQNIYDNGMSAENLFLSDFTETKDLDILVSSFDKISPAENQVTYFHDLAVAGVVRKLTGKEIEKMYNQLPETKLITFMDSGLRQKFAQDVQLSINLSKEKGKPPVLTDQQFTKIFGSTVH